MTTLDKGSSNPRLQCGECGRWMRLHGKRLEAIGGKIVEVTVQRFYGGCEVTKGDHPCGKDVCYKCCPTKCRERLCDCQHPETTPDGFAAKSEDCPVHGGDFRPMTSVL